MRQENAVMKIARKGEYPWDTKCIDPWSGWTRMEKAFILSEHSVNVTETMSTLPGGKPIGYLPIFLKTNFITAVVPALSTPRNIHSIPTIQRAIG